jgi:4-amino-4-deoxy-L-arabinose transferase-like glycosyltransferase
MKNLSKHFSKNRLILFLSILISFYYINAFIWLRFDTLPPAWDQAHHMLLSLKYFRLLSQEGISFLSMKNFFSISHYYPPFFHLSAIPIIFLLGFSEDNLIFVNFFYLILLIISLSGIAKILFNKKVGIVSSVLILFYPLVYGIFREYLIDFALLSLITATQFLILKSEGGKKKPWNILLGIISGITLLTKPVAIIFLMPLWIFIAYKKIKNNKDLLASVISSVVCLLIVIPWYLSALPDMLKLNSYWQNFAKTVEGDPSGLLTSIIWYAYEFKNTMVSQNLLFFLILGIVLFLIYDRRKYVLAVLTLCIFPAYFLLSLIPNKDARYIMPILPACTLLATGGIFALKNRIIKNTICLIIFVIGFIQFNNLTFAIPPFLVKPGNSFYNRSPLIQNWKIKEILEYISNYTGEKSVSIGILADTKYFNPPVFLLYADLFNMPYLIEGVGNFPITPELLKKYDIFITKYPKISLANMSFYREKFYMEMNDLEYNKLGFCKIGEFELPDNSKAFIYHKL